MLAYASVSPFAGPETPGSPNEPVDVQLLRSIASIERAAGAAEVASRNEAMSILAERDAALAAIEIVDPPAMSHAAFQQHLTSIMRELSGLSVTARPKGAA